MELTAEQRQAEHAEYARRDDRREEQHFWRDTFFASFEDERLTMEKIDRGCTIADSALDEFRRRFQ